MSAHAFALESLEKLQDCNLEFYFSKVCRACQSHRRDEASFTAEKLKHFIAVIRCHSDAIWISLTVEAVFLIFLLQSSFFEARQMVDLRHECHEIDSSCLLNSFTALISNPSLAERNKVFTSLLSKLECFNETEKDIISLLTAD